MGGGKPMWFIKQSFFSRSTLKKNIVKYTMTAAAVATIGIGIDYSTANASANSSITDGIQTVYHVYYGNKIVGTVNDKSVVNQVIGNKIITAEKKDPNHNYMVGQNITFIPEKMFTPVYNNNQTIQNLSQMMSVEAHAVTLQIGNQTIGYLKNQDQADELLHKLELQYLSNDDLQQYKANKDSGILDKIANGSAAVTDLKGSSNILDVSFSKKVSSTDAIVDPSQIQSVDQLLKEIETGSTAQKKYKVKSGDTLSGIASKFNMTTKELTKINHLNQDSLLHVGNELNVTAPEPLVNVVVKKYVSKDVSINYSVIKKENNDMYKGQTKVIQSGKKGTQHIEETQTINNGNVIQSQTISSNVTQKPVNEIVEVGTKIIPSRGTGVLHWPTVGGVITSPYGYRWGGEFHKGIDISGVTNRSILAADNGTVTYAQWNNGGYGNRVIIDHHDGMKTTYNHMAAIKVHVGQTVQQGQTIGIMGSTGDSTGMHLHFEVYVNGHLVNPMSELNR